MSSRTRRRSRHNGAMRIVVLTGAGISAESGVPTFRDAGGLWEGHRRRGCRDTRGLRGRPRHWCCASTTSGGGARHPSSRMPRIARWPRSRTPSADDLLVVTQNVDDLHERAGSRNLVHMHGELRRALCTACGARPEWTGDLVDRPPCPSAESGCCAPTSSGSARCRTVSTASSRPSSRATCSSRSARPARCTRPPATSRSPRRSARGRSSSISCRATRRCRSTRCAPAGRDRDRARVGRRGPRRAVTSPNADRPDPEGARRSAWTRAVRRRRRPCRQRASPRRAGPARAATTPSSRAGRSPR